MSTLEKPLSDGTDAPRLREQVGRDRVRLESTFTESVTVEANYGFGSKVVSTLSSLLPRLPKEEKFNHMLTDLARAAKESAQLLESLSVERDTLVKAQATRRITEVKAEASAVYKGLADELGSTFITPFDREDLRLLAHAIYMIPKMVDAIQFRMTTYGLASRHGDFSQFSTLIHRQSTLLSVLVEALNAGRQLDKLQLQAVAIESLEEQLDAVLVTLTADAFASIEDVREATLRKDIYDRFEELSNAHRDCANVAAQVVLKHS